MLPEILRFTELTRKGAISIGSRQGVPVLIRRSFDQDTGLPLPTETKTIDVDELKVRLAELQFQVDEINKVLALL